MHQHIDEYDYGIITINEMLINKHLRLKEPSCSSTIKH